MTTILVVDDMELFREPIAAALRSRGFEVKTAGDGHSALRLARNQPLDLVLLDLAMPGMDGLSVLASMRADSRLKDLPVILLTAVADRDYVIRAGKLGAKYYLLKTQFSIDQLVDRAKLVLAESTARRERSVESGPSPQQPLSDEKKTPPKPSSTDSLVEPVVISSATPGDPLAALKAIKPLIKRSEMYDRIDGAGELQALSPTVSKVIKLTERESSTAEEIARAIKQDSAMAIKILRLANSVAFARGQIVDTVDRAVARLGVSEIRQAMLNLNVIQHFGATNMCGRVNIGRFWEHSIACGIIAAQIATRRAPEEADIAFTMGLVHDLGRLLFMQELGDTYEQVLDTAERLGLPLEHVESRLLMVSHAEVMDRLLHAWHFPKELIDPVVFHHLPLADIRHMAAKRFHEVVTLALADRLCHALLIGDSGNRVLYPIEDYCEALGIDAEVIAHIEQIALDETSDLKLGLMTESSDEGWIDAREEVRGQLPDGFRPLVVSEKPVFDSVRIWCDQLCVAGNEEPTIAIVHAFLAASLPGLLDRLAKLEREEGVADLPLLVILPEGHNHSDTPVMQRAHQQLQMPLMESRFIEAIRNLDAASAGRKAA